MVCKAETGVSVFKRQLEKRLCEKSLDGEGAMSVAFKGGGLYRWVLRVCSANIQPLC